jgi:hypothetical protein
MADSFLMYESFGGRDRGERSLVTVPAERGTTADIAMLASYSQMSICCLIYLT